MILGGIAPAQTITFHQKLIGDHTSEAATCGTSSASTCVVPGTISAGDIAIIDSTTANAVTISSTNCGTFVPGQGFDPNGTTSTPNFVTKQFGWIIATTAHTNCTVTYSGAHGGAAAKMYTATPSGGTVALDATGGVLNLSSVTSPTADMAMTTSGTHSFCGRGAYANGGSGVTAVASPWNVAAQSNFDSDPNMNGMGSAALVDTSTAATWTNASNSANAFMSACIGTNVCASKNWVIQDGSGGTAGNTPASADLLAGATGYSGGGNTFSAPGWVLNNTNVPTYAAADITGLFSNWSTVRYQWSGKQYSVAASGQLVFKWTTTAGAPVNNAAIAWSPPAGTRHVSWVTSFATNIPQTEASGHRYSLPNASNGTDSMNGQIQGSGSALSLHLECNGTDKGSISALASSHVYFLEHEFNSVASGTNKITLYDSDGATSLGSLTCSNTTAADIQYVGVAGITGSETEASGHWIEWGPTKIDEAGATTPMLPGSGAASCGGAVAKTCTLALMGTGPC